MARDLAQTPTHRDHAGRADVPASRSSGRRVHLMGVDFDNLVEDEVIQEIVTALRLRRGGILVNPNVDVLRQAVRRADVKELIDAASLVIADGAPIVWSSKMAGTPLRARVPGADFIWAMCEAAAANSLTVFLLGGNEGVAESAAEILKSRYPSLLISGTYCPPFGFEHQHAEMLKLRSAVVGAHPDVVFCGLGFPKQEKLMRVLSGALPQTWFIGSGASLSFVAGEIERAPAYLRRLGLEWLHRLFQEPRRLFRRYVIDDAPFVLRLAGWAVRNRRPG